MASTYSTNLRLELIGTGEQAGTWGTTTNNNLGTLLDQAIAGYVAVVMGNADYTLTALNGTADEARRMLLNITSSTSLTQTRSVICPAVSKFYVVSNNTTGGQSITFTRGSGATVTIPNGETVTLFCDGTNVKLANTYAPTVNTTAVSLAGNLTFSGIGRRITGDFSGTSLANRVSFQTNEINAPTAVAALPNGSPGATAPTNFTAFNTSDPANSAYATLNITNTSANIGSSTTGSGAAVPVALVSGGNLSAYLPTTGGMYVGTTAAGGDVNNTKAVVAGAFLSQSGSVGAANNIATALCTLPDVAYGTWLFSVSLAAADPVNYSFVATVSVQSGVGLVVGLRNPGLLYIATTTRTVNVIQTSGATQTVYWSALRIQ